MLEVFEYFLSEKESQNNIINNLVKDFSQGAKILKDDGAIDWGTFLSKISMPTIISVANSFLSAPFQTIKLLDFYRNQAKHNTPEFQAALLESEATWGFVDRTADNLEKVSTLMTNLGVDIFDEGNPFDASGMEKIKGALKNPDVISVLKELSIATIQPNPNYLELSSKLLDMLDKAPNPSAYLKEKGESIQKYIVSAVNKQISQETEMQKKWDALLKLPQSKSLDNKKVKFLKEHGIAKELHDKILESNEIPKKFTDNLTKYGLKSTDINRILDIVPILLNSPGELKGMVDSINEGKYSNVVRQIIDLAETKPAVKGYLNNNKEVFANIIGNMMKDNKQFVDSGLSGQVYNLLPALFNNPKALNEIIDIFDNGDYSKMAPKIFDLISNDPEIKKYFSKNSKGFEKLATIMIQDSIAQNQEKIAAETKDWKNLDVKARRLYLDTDSKWKDISDTEKESMMKNEKLQDLSDTLSKYGVTNADIGAIAHVAMLTFDNSKHISTILEDMNKGDYTNMTKDIFNLFAESKEVREYLIEQKDFIGRIVKATALNTPELKDVDVTDLVPFLLKHPVELKEIVGLVEKEKYNEIAPKILELSLKDRGIADYLANNKVILAKVALKSTGFDEYKISNEISDILVHLTTEHNLPKLQELAKLASQEKWLKVGAGLADLIDKDPEFRESLAGNKENIDKIIKIVLNKNPSLKKSISSLETGALTNNILSDPGGVRDLLNAYENGNKKSLAVQIAKFTTKKIFDSEFRGAVYKSAVNWLYGKGEKQQEVVNAISSALDRGESPERLVMSEFVKSAFDEMSEGIKSPEEKKEFLQQIENKNFFENIKIEKFGREPLKLHNLDMNENQFVNTKFNNVSFNGTKMTNVAFHGATFERVSLSGATIDKATLEGLLPEILNGHIKLKNVKIEGSLDGMDLKDVSFVGSDLSGVTSMNNTTIAGGNLIGAILPNDKEVITQVFGLKSAMFGKDPKSGEQIITDEMYQSNQKIICTKISNQLIKKSSLDGVKLNDKQKSALENKVNELYADKSEIGERFKKAINENPAQILDGSFPEKIGSISNVSDFKGQASHQLTMLYNNITNPEKIEAAMVADIIAEKVTKNLFAKGDNRGKDGLMIQKNIEEAVNKFSEEYGIKPKEILLNSKFDDLINDLTTKTKSKTSSTSLGKLGSGGILLKEGAINADDFKNAFDIIALSEEKMPVKIADQIIAKADKNNIKIENKEELREAIAKIYNDKSEIGERFRKAIEENPNSLLDSNFPEELSDIKHFSEFKGTASHQLSILYNNINSPESMEAALVADIIGEQIASNILDNGNDRGQDALQIQKSVTEAVLAFSMESKTPLNDLLNSDKFEKIVSCIENDIQTQIEDYVGNTAYEALLWDENAISKEMVTGFKEWINLAAGDHALSKSEQKFVNELSSNIAQNIFKSNQDLEQISGLLEKTLYEIKAENPNINIEVNKEKLIGSIDKGWVSTSGEGLTKLFYDNCTSTGGSLSSSVQTSKFKESLKENISQALKPDIEKTVDKNLEKNTIETPNLVKKEEEKKISEEILKTSNEKIVENDTKEKTPELIIKETKKEVIEVIKEVSLNKGDHEVIEDLMLSISKNIFIPDESNIMVSYQGKSKIRDSLTQVLLEIKTENPDIDLKETIDANKESLVGSLKRGEWSWNGWSTTCDGLTKLFYEKEERAGLTLSDSVKTDEFKELLKENIEKTIEHNIKKAIHKSVDIDKKDQSPKIINEKAKKIGISLSETSSKQQINNKPANKKINNKSKTLNI
jgi:hypothetical protein